MTILLRQRLFESQIETFISQSCLNIFLKPPLKYYLKLVKRNVLGDVFQKIELILIFIFYIFEGQG